MYGDMMMMINKIKKNIQKKNFFSKTIVLVYIYIYMNVFYSIDNCFLYINIIIRYIYLSGDDDVNLRYAKLSLSSIHSDD